MNQKWIALLLALILALSVCGCAADKPQTETAETTAAVETRTAAGQSTVTDEELTQTAQWLMEQIPQPTYGSVGGEWAVFGLARSGVAVPKEYFEVYGENVAAYTAEHGGVLHAKKYTEYSRVILAWTALGKDATDVGGFNLLVPLADFDQTVFQGINGPIFALLALDSGGYEIPEVPEAETQATRELYVGELLQREIPDGGWALTGSTPDADVTAMALQALAKYRGRQDVEDAVQRGLAALSALQEPNGAYLSWDEENSESVCQVIVALTELGISLDDERFVKNGQTLPQVLERFACEDGSYRHSLNGGGDEMATEQALYALAAIHRAETGETTLYDMTDVMQ